MNVELSLIDPPAAPWPLPACTDLGAHRLAPARLLAVLERQQPAVVLMSAEQLRCLLAFPALALSDLGPLRQVLFVGSPAGDESLAERAMAQLGCQVQGFTPQWRDLNCAVQAHRRSRERAMAHPKVKHAVLHEQTLFVVPVGEQPITPDDHLDATAAALDRVFSHDRLAEAVRLNQLLDQAALLSMLNGLAHCDLLPAPVHHIDRCLAEAAIAPAHRALIARWLEVLQGQGLLRPEAGALHPSLAPAAWSDAHLEATWTRLAQDWMRNTGGQATLDYARDNARQLPALMRGECAAVHVLFPQGRTDRAAALYRENLAAQYQHHAVAHWVGAWAGRQRKTTPLRVLEIGAGTGATTQAVLPALSGAVADGTVDYLCTDVSRYFNEQSALRWQAVPWVRHAVFDIDRPAQAQGYPGQSWDLIIAGGVLNAARDTERTLGILLDALEPGGWLVFSEPTQEAFWVMASQAFMLGEAQDERQASRATFLDLGQWQTALARAGFQGQRSLPAAGHPLESLGHRVFVAQAPTTRLSRAALAAHLDDPDLHLEVVGRLPDPPVFKEPS